MQSQPLLLPLLYAYIIVIAKAYNKIILYPSNNAISLPPVTDMVGGGRQNNISMHQWYCHDIFILYMPCKLN
jgi:hypothetical protein